ncbi:hypothetical protein [uncultured Tenacibaculum sp.]|uniref:hypothetical protein n=1 Tax=uncultured Tenacibaculum sp. TaxID=174713 RepID=UPI00261622DA|nr:hypothetical protein [uncultured Tenacibaculum sp.]
MKKKIFIILTTIAFISCHSTKYYHSGNVNSSLNFQKGKWLLKNVESHKNIQDILTKIAKEEFKILLGKRFSIATNVGGIFVPNTIPNNPSKSILEDIKNGTGYDYLINIKAKKISDEVGFLETGNTLSSLENSGEITLEIYDLNLLEKIYSQSAIGKMHIPKNNEDFGFSKSADNIIITSLTRILKKIKKNQIK